MAVLAALFSAAATRAVVSNANTASAASANAAASADRQTATAAARRVGTAVLRRGDRGPRVSALQQLLRTVGVRGVAVDGRYGTSTVKAVRRFQRAGVLAVTGVANAQTLRKLVRAASTAVSASAPSTGGADASGTAIVPRHLGDRIPLRAGMSGKDVRVLQSYLRRAGFRVPITGEYDVRTIAKVKAFERASESPNRNGVMDAGELSALRLDVEGGSDSVADEDTTRTTPGEKAKLGADGLAIAPESAPDEVKQIIAAGNRIAKKPYVYGGGHARWDDRGYDCSGSVSYALRGAKLLDAPLPSGPLMSWGKAGKGDWVTIYSNPGHVFMVVAGLRFDTSGRSGNGSRWQTSMRPSSGNSIRHPAGL